MASIRKILALYDCSLTTVAKKCTFFLMKALQTISYLSLLFLLLSCASGDERKDKAQTEAEKVYWEAKELVDSNRFLLAVERLNYLKSTYPYSFYTKAADLLLADIYFMQESYEEATASYLLYKELHPRDEKMPYVLFRIAESYFQQVPSTNDRDLTPAKKAIAYFQELLNQYPSSEFTEGAIKKIEECKKKLRKKEKYIADFYFKTEVFQAAKVRYLRILQMYKEEPEAREIIHHSMVRFVESVYKLKEYKSCIEYGLELRQGLPVKHVKKINSIVNKCKAKV